MRQEVDLTAVDLQVAIKEMMTKRGGNAIELMDDNDGDHERGDEEGRFSLSRQQGEDKNMVKTRAEVMTLTMSRMAESR
jgi:hypothetical protein